MSVDLTFRKDFANDRADVMPYTVDGEPIGKVISCCVESGVDQLTRMTLVVYVTETVAENAAARLKK